MTDFNTEYADGWRPEEGDVLVGKVLTVDLGFSPQSGTHYPIVTVQPEDGGDPVAIHGFHMALKQRFMALKPVRGETIGVQYKGKEPHKTDRTKTVAVYVVKVKGRDADVWGTLGAAAAPALPPQGFQPHAPVDTSDFAPRPSQRPADDDDDIPF